MEPKLANAQAEGITIGTVNRTAELFERIMQEIGQEAHPGLRETPQRIIRAIEELTSGYAEDPAEILSTTFAERCDEMVVVRDIPFASLCEHHCLPFHGSISVGYVPSDRVVGLSKIPRLVNCFARRLQVQERLTNQIADSMMQVLSPVGVGVWVKGFHTCLALRGAKCNAEMVTQSLRGCMRTDAAARGEFLDLCR